MALTMIRPVELSNIPRTRPRAAGLLRVVRGVFRSRSIFFFTAGSLLLNIDQLCLEEEKGLGK